MAKRAGGGIGKRKKSHSRKTKKRLLVKYERMAQKAQKERFK